MKKQKNDNKRELQKKRENKKIVECNRKKHRQQTEEYMPLDDGR